MKIQELNNEEVVFTYVLLKDMLDEYDKIIDEGGISYVADSPFGSIGLFKEFSDEEHDKLSGSEKVRLFRSMTSKLGPIYDLIAETNISLVDSITKELHTKKDSDDQTEDLL
jgi:hypothetical protein